MNPNLSEHLPTKSPAKSTITSSHSRDMINSLLQCILIQLQPYQTAKKHPYLITISIQVLLPPFLSYIPPMSSLPTPNSTLNNIDITEEDVYEALCSADLSKAPEPDGIGQKIQKFRLTSICGPLLYLFTECLAQHTIPAEWRIHSITPIHKSGDRDNISNYRPISLLSCTSKLLERTIYNKSIDFITNTVVSTHQFGFLKHRSSVQQLLLLNTIYNSLLTHSPTDAIYLDFRKEFDTVSHPKLHFKLWSSGITGDLWMWFRGYLLDRQQYVTINGQQSNLLPVFLGIPQGSILGPLLFIIFINHLPLTINYSHLFLFADDTKCISPIHSPTESLNLQRDLQAIGAWSNQTNGAWLSMNPSVLTSVSSPTQTLCILHTTLTTCLSLF